VQICTAPHFIAIIIVSDSQEIRAARIGHNYAMLLLLLNNLRRRFRKETGSVTRDRILRSFLHALFDRIVASAAEAHAHR